MTTPGAPPQLSPDGRWWWDGTAWVPAPQAPPVVPNPFPNATYPPQPQYGGYPQQPSNNDALAIISLVASIVWLSGVGSIVGVVTGHLSRSKARREGRQPSGLALAGLIIGYIGIAGLVALIALFAFGAAIFSTALKANDASVKSQLRIAADAEETYFVDHETYTSDLTELSYTYDNDVTITVLSASSSGYCLEGEEGITFWYYDSAAGGLTRTPCS